MVRVMPTPPPDTRTIRHIAADAAADPRTVARVLRGEPVRGLVRERIDAALRARGIDTPPTERGGGARHEVP